MFVVPVVTSLSAIRVLFVIQIVYIVQNNAGPKISNTVARVTKILISNTEITPRNIIANVGISVIGELNNVQNVPDEATQKIISPENYLLKKNCKKPSMNQAP